MAVVRRWEQARLGRAQWIEVESAGRRIMLGPPPVSSTRGVLVSLGARWEPRLLDLLAGASGVR